MSMKEEFVQFIEALLVLLGGSDGNTNPFRKFVSPHRPDNDPFFQKLTEDLIPVPHLYESKIGMTGNKFPTSLRECVFEKPKPRGIVFDRGGDMVAGPKDPGLSKRCA